MLTLKSAIALEHTLFSSSYCDPDSVVPAAVLLVLECCAEVGVAVGVAVCQNKLCPVLVPASALGVEL
jgi:hypothetical protein